MRYSQDTTYKAIGRKCADGPYRFADLDTPSVQIYGLYDPRDGEIFYIGRTGRDLEDRLYGHIHSWTSIPVRYRVQEILAEGLTPEIGILALADAEEANAVEWAAIVRYREMGYRLLNAPYYHPYHSQRGR
jgi:hypothetical protein